MERPSSMGSEPRGASAAGKADDIRPERHTGRSETRFEKARTTDRESRKLIDADLQSTRKKTVDLKAQRLAKEAREGVIDLDKKKPTKRKWVVSQFEIPPP